MFKKDVGMGFLVRSLHIDRVDTSFGGAGSKLLVTRILILGNISNIPQFI
jgi:hypothetical protein